MSYGTGTVGATGGVRRGAATNAVGREEIRLAAKLLAKAELTDSDAEAVALALRSYSLVARWLNANEPPAGPRVRERRLLRERRRPEPVSPPPTGQASPLADIQTARYRRFAASDQAASLKVRL